MLWSCIKWTNEYDNAISTKIIVIFLDFHLTTQGQPLADSWSHGLD